MHGLAEHCTSACGDGLLAAGRETCDDMNTTSGDGCSAMCATESGYTCMGATCTAICGDGMMVGTEACDDMNTVTEACAYGLMRCTVCDATCNSVPGATSFCSDSTDIQTASATVLPNFGTYLPVAFARALALAGTQVHIRTAGAATTRSITSVPDTLPIQNLRAGLILTNYSPFRMTSDSVAALWTGPFAANAQYLWHACGPVPFGVSAGYPAIYQACGNGGGMHVTGATSGWMVAGGENMEVWVR